MDKKPIKYIKVKAVENFANRRFKTLKGLTLKLLILPTFLLDQRKSSWLAE